MKSSSRCALAGLALMAGVTVKRRPMPGEEHRKRLPG